MQAAGRENGKGLCYPSGRWRFTTRSDEKFAEEKKIKNGFGAARWAVSAAAGGSRAARLRPNAS